jgi:hypothetical protein
VKKILKKILWASIMLIPMRATEARTTPANDSRHHEIQTLKQQIAALTEKVNALQKREAEIHYKEKVTKTEQAPINMIQSGNDKAKLTISGWVNRGMAYYDNSRNSEWKHVDVNEYSSRLNIGAEANVSPSFRVGSTIQMEVKSNSSSAVDIGQDDNQSANVSFTKRIIEVYVDHAKFGKLSVGQGKTASDQVADLDLTDTNVLSEGADLGSFAGGVRFIKGNLPQGALAPIPGATQGGSDSPDRDRTAGSVWQDVMGGRRLDRVRYDTPVFYGVTLSASHATRDVSEYAVRYAGEWWNTKVVGAFGYANVPYSAYPSGSGTQTVRKGTRQYGGSAFLLFPIGFSVGGSGAAKVYGDPGRKTGTLWTVKAGYQHKFFDWGNTCFAVTYGEGQALYDGTSTTNPSRYTPTTFLEDNSEKIKVYGAYVVQNIDKAATEIFAGVQNHELRRNPYGQMPFIQANGYGFKRILALIFGARVKF